MRILKRGLALFLAVLTVAGIAAVTVSAEKSQYQTYTVIGDSNASGYGLDAYAEQAGDPYLLREGNVISGSFADTLAKELGIENVNSCAHCAWRTNEFLYIVNPEKYGDLKNDYMLKALGYDSEINVEEWRKKIDNGIKEADLITVSFGSNDIYTYALRDLYEDGISLDNHTPLGWLHEFELRIGENLERFKENMPKIIDEIRQKNDHAKIVIIGMFNPLNVSYMGKSGLYVSLMSTMDILTAKVNEFQKECAEEKECVFADVTKAQTYGVEVIDFELLLSGDEKGTLSVIKMLHANQKGHDYIAEQVLEALKNSEIAAPEVTVVKSPVTKKNIVKWNKIDGAKTYRVYRSKTIDGKYSLVGITVGTSYLDGLSLSKTQYYYKVCAVVDCLSGVCSPMSEPVTVQ